MRTYGILCLFFLVAPLVAADSEPIRLDLRKFDFKVPPAQADLFGYDDGEQRLFFYAGASARPPSSFPPKANMRSPFAPPAIRRLTSGPNSN